MLNEKIKALRLSCGLNQIELAKTMGVTKQCISNWENDNIQPSVEMLIKLARFFNVTCDYLLDMENSRTINVDGLSEQQISHISLLVNDLKRQ